MEEKHFKGTKGSFSFNKLVVLVVAIAVIAVVYVLFSLSNSSASVSKNDKIDITPTQIKDIQDIGEWEFLTINTEEMIDTVRTGFFGDSELIRIYYGTLRLGIDFKKAKQGWIKMNGDTVVATLSNIVLLDNNFIDEAKSNSFFEKGSWDNSVKNAMYKQAYTKMIKRCFTKDNVEAAQQNAITQVKNLIMAMGFKNVIVKFDKNNKKGQ